MNTPQPRCVIKPPKTDIYSEAPLLRTHQRAQNTTTATTNHPAGQLHAPPHQPQTRNNTPPDPNTPPKHPTSTQHPAQRPQQEPNHPPNHSHEQSGLADAPGRLTGLVRHDTARERDTTLDRPGPLYDGSPGFTEACGAEVADSTTAGLAVASTASVSPQSVERFARMGKCHGTAPSTASVD